MKDSGSKDPVNRIKQWPDKREQEQSPSPLPTLGEGLSIPRKVGYRAHRTQIEQAPLDPPVNGGAQIANPG